MHNILCISKLKAPSFPLRTAMQRVVFTTVNSTARGTLFTRNLTRICFASVVREEYAALCCALFVSVVCKQSQCHRHSGLAVRLRTYGLSGISTRICLVCISERTGSAQIANGILNSVYNVFTFYRRRCVNKIMRPCGRFTCRWPIGYLWGRQLSSIRFYPFHLCISNYKHTIPEFIADPITELVHFSYKFDDMHIFHMFISICIYQNARHAIILI